MFLCFDHDRAFSWYLTLQPWLTLLFRLVILCNNRHLSAPRRRVTQWNSRFQLECMLRYPCAQLAITKTRGDLGRNQQRKGTWDRLDGHDKNSKQKCRTTIIVAVCSARYCEAIVLSLHFCLLAWLIDWILSLQTVPSAIAVVIRTQLPLVLVMANLGFEKMYGTRLSLSIAAKH